jgi:hypothetical protein
MPCGPDAGPILDSIGQARDAGIDPIYLNHIGHPLDGFIDFWSEELRPGLQWGTGPTIEEATGVNPGGFFLSSLVSLYRLSVTSQ